MRPRIFIVAMMLASAAGCSQEAPSAANAMPVAAAPAAQQAQQGIGDVTFSLTPGSFRICDAENGAIAATAKWDVTARGISEVSVYVTDAKGERKLWLSGGASGESTTGNWVFPDSKFELVERASEKAIAELTVKATSCT